MLRGEYDALIKTAAFVIIFRTLFRDLYDRFLAGSALDEEVADAFFGRLEPDYRAGMEGNILETEIVMAAAEEGLARTGDFAQTSSRLLNRYLKLVNDSEARNPAVPEHERAHDIVRFVDTEYRNRRARGGSRQFRDTVARIEMLSGDLRWDHLEPSDQRQDVEELH